jgi:hypothetical protein
MPAHQHRYERSIADTEKAVETMRKDYRNLESPSPHAYISSLHDEYEGSNAHMITNAIIAHHRTALAAPHFGLAMARMGLSTNIKDTEFFYHGQQFTDGLMLGLAASDYSFNGDFDSIMAQQLAKTMDMKNVLPHHFVHRITQIGTETYELDLDRPPLPDAVYEEEQPKILRTFAEQLLSDLYDNETKNNFFRVGAGLARHAYNSYIILGDDEFEKIMSGSDFDSTGFSL